MASAVAMLLLSVPNAQAEQVRIGLNGARASDLPAFAGALAGAGFSNDGWLNYASKVGQNWLPGLTSFGLDYPAQLGSLWGNGALTGDQSIAAGQQILDSAIRAQLALGNTVAATGVSLGSMVLDAELRYLATDPNAPAADAITFYIFGGENRGFGATYMPGKTLPVVNTTFIKVPETKYNVVLVMEEWDGWANTPDRPWNLLADINAVMGVFYTVGGSNDHSKAAQDSMADAVLMSAITNAQGGTTSTYMVRTDDLPLTRPLRQLGVPANVVDQLNKLLMPIIRAGYSWMTPNLGPHFENGKLVTTTSAAPDQPTDTPTNNSSTPAPVASVAQAASSGAASSGAAESARNGRIAARKVGSLPAATSMVSTEKAIAPESGPSDFTVTPTQSTQADPSSTGPAAGASADTGADTTAAVTAHDSQPRHAKTDNADSSGPGAGTVPKHSRPQHAKSDNASTGTSRSAAKQSKQSQPRHSR